MGLEFADDFDHAVGVAEAGVAEEVVVAGVARLHFPGDFQQQRQVGP